MVISDPVTSRSALAADCRRCGWAARSAGVTPSMDTRAALAGAGRSSLPVWSVMPPPIRGHRSVLVPRVSYTAPIPVAGGRWIQPSRTPGNQSRVTRLTEFLKVHPHPVLTGACTVEHELLDSARADGEDAGDVVGETRCRLAEHAPDRRRRTGVEIVAVGVQQRRHGLDIGPRSYSVSSGQRFSSGATTSALVVDDNDVSVDRPQLLQRRQVPSARGAIRDPNAASICLTTAAWVTGVKLLMPWM